ncbi:NAD(P)H-dependent oxidoreductase [Thermodesulfobacteriota bacterium]
MKIITTFFYHVRSWPALLLFFGLRQEFDSGTAALAAAVYTLLFTLVASGAGRVTKLDYGMVFFWSAGLLSLQTPLAFWEEYFTTGIFLSLFLAAYLPTVFNAEPFTTAFARQQAPQEVWNTEQFKSMNRIMSLAWAGLFLAAMLITLLPGVWFQIVIPLLLMVGIGVPFNKKYPLYAMNKTGELTTLEPNPKACEQTIIQNPGPSLGITKKQESANPVPGKPFDTINDAVIVFGSPRGKKGYTYELLEHFVNGMIDNGIACEILFLNQYRIKECSGCFNCWTTTPGVCIHQDDMHKLLDKIVTADLVVYAQPLYTFSVPGIMKTFLDRMLPHLEPWLVKQPDGSTRHPLRWRNNHSRMLIFSVCGFPEVGHFQPMLEMYRAISKHSGIPIIGELLRPASESLLFRDRFATQYQHLRNALYEAGGQVASQGHVDKKNERLIATPFHSDMEKFRIVANRTWETMIEYETLKKNGADLPKRQAYLLNHPRMLFGGMASLFRPELAGDLAGILQFAITDRENGHYYFEIGNQQCDLHEGKNNAPDLTVTTPWDVWIDVSSGKISGQEAYMQGLYQAEGDLNLLVSFKEAIKPDLS